MRHAETSLDRIRQAIKELPWKDAVKFPPPHQYVVLDRCPVESWDALATTIRESPDAFLAYFRGYQRPMRYWEFKGWRYWQTSSTAYGRLTYMLNRCTLDSVEPPRRVDEGAQPIPWDGPPWEPIGSPWPAGFERQPDGQYAYRPELDPDPLGLNGPMRGSAP